MDIYFGLSNHCNAIHSFVYPVWIFFLNNLSGNQKTKNAHNIYIKVVYLKKKKRSL